MLKRIDLRLLTLSLFFCLNAILIIYYAGKEGTFFLIDPDGMYSANAFSMIRFGKIYYLDHPGVFAISLMSVFLYIVRVVFYVWGVNFYEFVYQNYDIAFVTLRLFQTSVLAIGMFLFSSAVKKSSGSYLITILSLLCLALATPFYFLGISISAETTSFAVISFWLYVYFNFQKKNSLGNLYLLSFIAGISLGNRLTNLFVVAATIVMALIYYFENRKKIKAIFISLGFIIIGFLSSTIFVLDRVGQIFGRTLQWASTTEVHGGGEKKWFEINAYISSAKSLIYSEKFAFIVIIICIFIFLLYLKEIIKNKNYYLLGVFGTILLGVLAFAKYPLSHYQFPNYVVLVGLTAGLIKKLDLLPKIFLILIVSYCVFLFGSRVTISSINEVDKSKALGHYVNINRNGPTVWEWARSKEFGIIWGNDWANNVYVQETLANKNLFSLTSDMRNVRDYSGDMKDLFSICWDKLYIQDYSIKKFLEINKEKLNFFEEIKEIENTGKMWVVVANHCSTKS